MLLATPAVRRQPDVLAGAAAWFATTVAVLVGNVRVVDDLVAAGVGKVGTADVPDVLFPPWIIPGAGVVVLVGARGVARVSQPPEL